MVIGASTVDAALERDGDLAVEVPLLARVTPLIGHFQIRNRGTVGGSIAHADPAAEYPAVALVALYAMSFPAVFDYVTFMKVEKTAYLKIRFDWLYSIYVVFVVATIVRYLWLCVLTLRGQAPEEFDPTKAGSGV